MYLKFIFLPFKFKEIIEGMRTKRLKRKKYVCRCINSIFSLFTFNFKNNSEYFNSKKIGKFLKVSTNEIFNL